MNRNRPLGYNWLKQCVHTSHIKRSHQTLDSVRHLMPMCLNKFSPCSIEPWVSQEPLHLCDQEGILLPPLIPLSLSEKGLSVASGVKQDCGRMHLRMNAITINWFGAYFDIFGGLREEIQHILCIVLLILELHCLPMNIFLWVDCCSEISSFLMWAIV